jgi:glutaredoxin
MKQVFSILFTLFTITLFAQPKELDIIKSENGNEITFFAKSGVREGMLVEFNIEGNGFTTSCSMPTKLELKSYEKKEVVKIKLSEGASYKISYKYSKKATGNPVSTSSIATSEKKERPELLKGIVVFSKDGCGKCEMAKNDLTKKKKEFKVLNISTSEEDQNYMWQKLQEAGFSGGNVQTPVIMVDGKIHYNMDLKLFLADIN